MATRSFIVDASEPDSIRRIYCHWDGYPEHHWPILTEHYANQDAVNELIGLGSISQLCERANPSGPHSYDKPEAGVTVAYMRDRGEKGQEATTHATIESACRYRDGGNEVAYVWNGTAWRYYPSPGRDGTEEMLAELEEGGAA